MLLCGRFIVPRKLNMPTYEQLLKVAQVCHSLSEMNQEILLFFYDEDTIEFFILAGKRATIEITIYPDSTHKIEIDDEL